MPGEGRTASKRLLAVGVRAFVGALAGVDTTVTSKGAAVAKGLATALTHMGLLSGMNSLMNSEGRTLNELLAALVANVGTNTAVNTFMTSEVAPPGETLAASSARESLDLGLGSGIHFGHAHVGRSTRQDHGDGGRRNVLLLGVARHSHLHRTAVHGSRRMVRPRHAIENGSRSGIARVL